MSTKDNSDAVGKWENLFGSIGSTVLLFTGGYLMMNQPSGIGGDPFAAGLWSTLLGMTLALVSIIKAGLEGEME